MTGTKKTVSQKPSSTDNTKDETNVEDNTISKGILPQTGSTTVHIVIFIMALLSVIVIICYRKIKFYNFK